MVWAQPETVVSKGRGTLWFCSVDMVNVVVIPLQRRITMSKADRAAQAGPRAVSGSTSTRNKITLIDDLNLTSFIGIL